MSVKCSTNSRWMISSSLDVRRGSNFPFFFPTIHGHDRIVTYWNMAQVSSVPLPPPQVMAFWKLQNMIMFLQTSHQGGVIIMCIPCDLHSGRQFHSSSESGILSLKSHKACYWSEWRICEWLKFVCLFVCRCCFFKGEGSGWESVRRRDLKNMAHNYVNT